MFEATPAAHRLKCLLNDEALLAIAVALLIVQFSQLHWESNYIAAILPPTRVPYFQRIVAEFARAFGYEAVKEFKLVWDAPFSRSLVRCKDELLNEKKVLFIDLASDAEWLKAAVRELAPAFPQEIKILSLFESDS